uniref:Uncharacterized protein n=1 Tax=Panagrolaimus superbus TaxID=310955 RepID=A0A914YF64_9BILA
MVEFIVPRSFLFYHVDLIRMLFGAHDIKQEILFETVYKLAENEATKKQALSLDADFNFDDTIKREMIRVLSKFKFDEMNLKFVVEFVVVKRFLFSVQQLYDLLIKCQRNANQEEIFFKAVYMLAEKSVMEKQEVNLAENFDMKSAVKEEMMKYLYHFKFSLMSLEFLTDFVGC